MATATSVKVRDWVNIREPEIAAKMKAEGYEIKKYWEAYETL